mmetsp:Transcript_20789/g.59576  ORF Transcript_20789/g.59576 Transcript_20789/m.59576 type:complete len:222 (-) Transcript_20789:322-987(-)
MPRPEVKEGVRYGPICGGGGPGSSPSVPEMRLNPPPSSPPWTRSARSAPPPAATPFSPPIAIISLTTCPATCPATSLLAISSATALATAAAPPPPAPLPSCGRMSGASSRSACPTFFRAFSSPMSHHVPSLSSLRNRPGGSSRRIRRTMSLAMCAFSSFRVLGLRYVDFMLAMMVRNWTLPGWALIRPPRPDRTSLQLGVSMGPMPRGKTSLLGGGMERVP